jgi:hypothetical protein
MDDRHKVCAALKVLFGYSMHIHHHAKHTYRRTRLRRHLQVEE